MAKPYSLSPFDLFARLGTADTPTIVDVCLEEDHALDPRVIPGARRMAFRQAAKSLDSGRGTMCVVTCQKGLKLSQGVAAALRAQGADAVFLEGGMVAWADAGLPAWPVEISHTIGIAGAWWVVPVDLSPSILLDAWTIRRFVDQEAQWLSVEQAQIAQVAERFDAASVELAAVLRAQDGAFQTQFAKLEALCQSESMAEMLTAHCTLHAASNNWLDKIAPAFDALWASARGPAA